MENFEFLERVNEITRNWANGTRAVDVFSELKSVLNDVTANQKRLYENQLNLKKENAQLKKKLKLLEAEPLWDKKKLGFTRNTPYLNALEYEERRKKEAAEIDNASRSLKCDSIPEIDALANQTPRCTT